MEHKERICDPSAHFSGFKLVLVRNCYLQLFLLSICCRKNNDNDEDHNDYEDHEHDNSDDDDNNGDDDDGDDDDNDDDDGDQDDEDHDYKVLRSVAIITTNPTSMSGTVVLIHISLHL